MIRLSINDTLSLHDILIKKTGGANNIRDINLLESALSSCYATFGGVDLYPTLEEKGARLGYSLISNHAFIDGNKRIGVLVMLTFLKVNGKTITATNTDVINLGLGVASGKMNYQDTLMWVKTFTK